MKNDVRVGLILRPHGINGAVSIKSYTEDPIQIFRYNPLHNKEKSILFYFSPISHIKNRLIVKIKNVNDRTQAETLKGFELYIPKTRLPKIENKDEFYIQDLIGLKVHLIDGSFFGKVKNIGNICSNTVIEIFSEKSCDRLIVLPFIKKYIIDVKIKNNPKIVIDIPRNLLKK